MRTKDELLELRVVRKVNADIGLHRVDAPGIHLFFVDEGAVRLYESGSTEPMEISGEQAFWRMIFLTGLLRALEAQVAKILGFSQSPTTHSWKNVKNL